MYYMALDGGGTKLEAVCFDDDLNLLSRARAQGTHLSVYPIEQVRNNIKKCYGELFSSLKKPIHIEKMYVICGDDALYTELLPREVSLGEAVSLGEGVAGIYAGLAKDTGFVALSGTGSDVFAVENGRCIDVIGGWGAILGDEGSGVWLSRKAMEAAIRFEEGWGDYTEFGNAICRHLKLNKLSEVISYLYSRPAPFRSLGELLPLAAETAEKGDGVIRDIFIRGGRLLARQMISLLDRHPQLPKEITACGGAWKSCDYLREGFEDELKTVYPEVVFTMPLFEHIAAGPIALMLQRGESREKTVEAVTKKFPMYVRK